MSEAVFGTLLNHIFSQSRRTRIADGQGGWVIGYADVGTMMGRIRPASGAEIEVARVEGRQISHVFYCKATEDVQRGDQVELAADDGGPLVVDVMGVRQPSRAGHHLEVDCWERQGEGVLEEGS